MAGTLEKVVFDDVEIMLREALMLNDDVDITANTKLIDLGAEPIDVLEIYFKLGLNFSDYTSGERINDKGKEQLSTITKALRTYYKWGDKAMADHFRALSESENTNQFISQLEVGDLITIKNYECEADRVKEFLN